MHKRDGFSAKPLGKSLFHCQNVWSDHGPAGQFWLLESALSPCKNILLEMFGFETFLSIPEICGLNDKRRKLCFLLKERIKHYILCWNDDAVRFTDQLGKHTFTTNVNLRLKISQTRRMVDKNWPNDPISYNRRKKEFLFVVEIKKTVHSELKEIVSGRVTSIVKVIHMTSRRPYWCSRTLERRLCLCSKPILWELNSFLM